MHAGHFQGRGFQGTRFDERNVAMQCPYCNTFRDGCGPDYFRFMQDKYGDDVIDELRRNKLKNFTRWELEEMIEHYKELVKEII